ncbi:MAG: DEAD/DEAH box helicase [Clostridiales bacterium]|nr:DEAD/DEAH box helicase [Clostridiales bacterium]
MTFYKLGIKGDLVYALDSQDITKPTPIQELSIPVVLSGKDLIAEAQTGTGKTLAFLLPMFQMIDAGNSNIQGLVITPTRELALQITEVAKKLSETKEVNILTAYGGQDVNAQLHKLKGNIQLVIGTPGRLLDHIRRGSIDFDFLKILVVDEADQMFHIGFKKDIKDIMKQLPKDRQTLCYSATISHTVDSFSKNFLIDPTYVIAPKNQITLDNIAQFVVETSNRKKYEDFLKIIHQNKPSKAIVFARSRMGAHTLYEEMLKSGFSVESLHGALTQAKREFVMNAFRNNEIDFLVATDVAARGIDVDGISHIFNYNLPDDPENYVHRIGRTGRAGNGGVAYTMLTEKDAKRLEEIETFINLKIDRIRLALPIEKKLTEKSATKTQKGKTITPSSKKATHSKNSKTSKKGFKKRNVKKILN